MSHRAAQPGLAHAGDVPPSSPARRRRAAPPSGAVIDLTASSLALAARGWLLAAETALSRGRALPALPEALTQVQTLDRLAELSACRFDVVKALVAEAHDYRVCDRLWDVLVWQLAAASESVLRDELEALARTDPLTGLLNRRGLAEALDREVARARRTGDTVSLVLLDLDRFKGLNDRHGHAAGDAALRAVAELLADGLRASDVAGRWGGDEFGVVLAGLTADAARDVVDRLRSTFTHPSYRRVFPGGISFSAGVADLAGADTDSARLMELADRALYAAKAEGGNRARRHRTG